MNFVVVYSIISMFPCPNSESDALTPAAKREFLAPGRWHILSDTGTGFKLSAAQTEDSVHSGKCLMHLSRPAPPAAANCAAPEVRVSRRPLLDERAWRRMRFTAKL